MGLLVKNTNLTLRVSLTVLRLTGFWPPNDFEGWKLVLFYSYGFLWFMFLLGVFLFTEVGDLISVWGNLPLMTATTFFLFTNIAHALKFISLVTRRKSISNMITTSDKSLRAEKSIEGRNIIKSCDRETCQHLIIYLLLTFVTAVGFATSSKNNKLPFRAWYPYDTNKSPAYELTYIHQVFAVSLAALLNVSKDSLVTTLIAQCRCRLRLVGISLRNLCKDQHITEEHTPDSISLKASSKTLLLTADQEKTVQKYLKVYAMEHQEVLETVELLQNTFSEPIFIQFNVSRLIICLSAFQLVSETTDPIRFLSLGTYLMNMLFQVFTYCYQGDMLSSESENVAEAAYDVPWYSCSVRVRSSIQIVMVRCRRIAKITVGGLTVLSLDTFTAILKTSYSLFTLLQQVTE